MSDQPFSESGTGTGALRAAGIALIAVILITKLVGFVREIVVAAAYGTSQVVDIYIVAITFPALVSTVIHHTIPNAFVPLLTGDSASRTSARRMTLLAIGLIGLLAAGMALLAEPIAAITNAGFAPALRLETVWILRLTSVTVILTAIEAFARSRLLVEKRFAWSGLAYTWQGAAIISAVLLWPGGGTRTLAWGYLIGTALTALWNLLRIGRVPSQGHRPREAAKQGAAGLHIWVIMIILADVIAQLFGLIDRRIGSYLTAGSIASLQYANLVYSLPLSIAGFGLATAIFPYVSEAVGMHDRRRAVEIVDWALRWSLLGMIPVAVWLTVHSGPIVEVLLERGAFDAQSRVLTASCLVAYAIGLAPAVLSTVLVRLFHANRNWRPILFCVIAGLATKVVLALWWVGLAGAPGLAAATSASQGVMLLVLVIAGIRAGYMLRSGRWAMSTIVVLILALTGALLSRTLVAILHLPREWGVIVEPLVSVLLGAVLILELAPRLGVPEIARVGRWMRSSVSLRSIRNQK